MYAYRFKGRRYDIGDKQGFLEATVEFALKRPELRRGFVQYLADMFGRETSDRAVEDILAQMEHARKQ
jgi:UTP--glucose-1-phosphate uridylyltransferase